MTTAPPATPPRGPSATPSDAQLATQKIKTEHVYPPIPVRSFDWCAWFDGMDEETRGQGWGKTEAEAIANLKEIYGIECRCGETAKSMAFKTCSIGGCHIGADL